ncbi:MAG TPA: pilus assembly protein TadG-related protein [Candidatus Sulfotelmatobacter sp.]|nr:pilus assembly protein TadG-related protein [Candidatus Sulfotelmatobacter sp.]
MKPTLIPRQLPAHRQGERGVTMALVAAALVAIMAMAALSIDAVTLYLANAEAQRAADAAALAGARVLSLSGITGDPLNATDSWTPACTLAQQVATALATQNTMGGAAITASQVAVTFRDRNGNDCTSSGAVAFGVNPMVQVKIQRTDLPTFFARVWGTQGSSVSAIGTAEVFNSSDAKDFNAANLQVPIQPRCVKPWIVPDRDPFGGRIVATSDGSITRPGVLQLGGGVIGESFQLVADCLGSNCNPPKPDNPPAANGASTPKTLDYVPALIQTPASAVPSCATTDYQKAIAGCDQATVYACGQTNGATADLTINPGGSSGDSATGAQCLIHAASGADSINTGTVITPVFPFQIQAGGGNPLVKAGIIASGAVITASNSIVTVPMYDDTVALAGAQPDVTITGFLQVFINSVDTTTGNINVTVLNVTGCGNTGTAGVTGSSPVPIRLVTNQ